MATQPIQLPQFNLGARVSWTENSAEHEGLYVGADLYFPDYARVDPFDSSLLRNGEKSVMVHSSQLRPPSPARPQARVLEFKKPEPKPAQPKTEQPDPAPMSEPLPEPEQPKPEPVPATLKAETKPPAAPADTPKPELPKAAEQPKQRAQSEFLRPDFLATAKKIISWGGHVMYCNEGEKFGGLPTGWPALATRDMAQAEKWAQEDPHRNCLLVGKPDGLLAVDVDSDMLERYEAQHGRIKTTRQRSVSGGTHLIFKQTDATRAFGNFGKKDANDGELWSNRADNRYIVAFGSTAHPNDDPNLPLAQYGLDDDIPPIEMPDDFLMFLREEAGLSREVKVVVPIGTEEQEAIAARVESAFTGVSSDLPLLNYKRREVYQGGFRWHVDCPWMESHTWATKPVENGGTSSAVIMKPNGDMNYVCQHTTVCADKSWTDLCEYLQQQANEAADKAGRPRERLILPGIAYVGSVPPGKTTADVAKTSAAKATAATTDIKLKPGHWNVDYLESHADDCPCGHCKPKQTARSRSLHITRGDEVKPERLEWIWNYRILRGYISSFVGDGGIGKGTISVDVAARLTRHWDFPDCKNELDGPKEVMFMGTEDGIRDTLVPRLIVAGADMSKVHFATIEVTTEDGSSVQDVINLQHDLALLEKGLKELPDVILVVIDPVISFFGDADYNKDKDVRPIYDKMAALAQRLHIGFLPINHPNKNQQASVANRTSGAKSMYNGPRSQMSFEKHPDEKGYYLMMQAKKNLAPNIKALKYHIVGEDLDFQDGKPPQSIAKIAWDGETDHDIDEVIAEAGTPKTSNKKAEDFLAETLESGAMPAREIYSLGKKKKLTADQLKRAQKDLEYVVENIAGAWYWAKSQEDMEAKTTERYTPKPAVVGSADIPDNEDVPEPDYFAGSNGEPVPARPEGSTAAEDAAPKTGTQSSLFADKRAKAEAMFAVGVSISSVALELKISKGTVATWHTRWKKAA